MLFNAAHMSTDEYKFIRTYVRVMQYRYDALQAVMAYMHPENLAVPSVLQAATVEHKMSLMQADFEDRLHAIAEKDKLAERKLSRRGPSAEELADIVMLSFFKVVGVMHNQSGVVVPNNKYGWFSGKPKDWEKLLEKLLENTKGPDPAFTDDLFSQCLNAVAKLFPGYNKKSWSKLYPPNYKYKHNFYEADPYFDDADDEYYEDDDDLSGTD